MNAPLEPTLKWIHDKFGKNPAVLEANTRTLKAGYNYGETTEAIAVHYHVAKAAIKPGRYRKITGNEAIAIGLAAATQLAKIPLVLCQLSDHAGQRYPASPGRSEALRRAHAAGRGRNRRHGHGHRRLVRRSHGRHRRPAGPGSASNPKPSAWRS